MHVDGRPFTVDVAEVVEAKHPTREKRGRAARDAEIGLTIRSPMHGVILRLPAGEGLEVDAGDVVCVIEAMKMENEVITPQAGVVTAVQVKLGDTVENSAPLLHRANRALRATRSPRTLRTQCMPLDGSQPSQLARCLDLQDFAS